MVDISSALATTMIGMLGVVIGAIISNYINQKIARQSAKKDIILKKKIEYFEKIIIAVENNTKLYQKLTKKAEKSSSKRKIAILLKELKTNRKKFEVMTSPLYLDTRDISRKITRFVSIEKKIFESFENLNKINYAKADIIQNLKINLADLRISGTGIITTLRENLLKE